MSTLNTVDSLHINKSFNRQLNQAKDNRIQQAAQQVERGFKNEKASAHENNKQIRNQAIKQIHQPNAQTENRQRIPTLNQQVKKVKNSLPGDDQLYAKKKFISILIIAFFLLQFFYAISYKLEYFAFINLALIIWWITTPQNNKNVKNVKIYFFNNQLRAQLRSYMSTLTSQIFNHQQITRPIFRAIFFNLVVVDLVFFKIVISKCGVFSTYLQKINFVNNFLTHYIDLHFVNTVQISLLHAIQRFSNQIKLQLILKSDQNQFFMISIFKILAKAIFKIYVILAIVFQFLFQVISDIIINSQYLVYVTLLGICTYLAFNKIFKLNKKIQSLIKTVKEEILININTLKEIPYNYEKTEKKIRQNVYELEHEMRLKGQLKYIEKSPKMKRKNSRDLAYSQCDSEELQKSYEIQDQTSMHYQISKNLVLLSLCIMYALCFLVTNDHYFIFTFIKVKQLWCLLLVMYAFFIVEYCKKNHRLGVKVNEDEFWFKIKIYVVTLLTAILILYDLVVSKSQCQHHIAQMNFNSNMLCMQDQTGYVFYFSSIFYNSHLNQPDPVSHHLKLNFLLEYAVKVILLMNLRYHKYFLLGENYYSPAFERPNYKQLAFEQQASESEITPQLTQSIFTINSNSSAKTFIQRRRMSKVNKSLGLNTLVFFILVVLVTTLTNSIGNVVILIGVFVNIPSYKDDLFRKYVMVGLGLGLFLQENQLLYFVLLMVLLHLKGQDTELGKHSYWMVIQFSRAYIILSKVSVINFLMGMLQSSRFVAVCIFFRITANYFDLVSVFMGTESYHQKSYFFNLLPQSFFNDIGLWAYMIALKTFTPNLINTFKQKTRDNKEKDTQITNIFQQYPLIERVQYILKGLKVIQLIAYITIEMIVITQAPSIIVFIRLFLHLVIAGVDLTNKKANQTLKNLWKTNLYVSLFIAALKYFYLISRYDNLSDWLITLLQPLKQNWAIIGLWPINKTDSMWSLLYIFFTDILVILLSYLVVYTLQVRIYQSYRTIFVTNRTIDPFDSINSLAQMDQIRQQQISISETSQKDLKKDPDSARVIDSYKNLAFHRLPSKDLDIMQRQIKQSKQKIKIQSMKKIDRNINYLYKNYVRAIEFRFSQKSRMGNILSDFLFDSYFIVLCSIYFFFQDHSLQNYWYYLPHFAIAFYTFVRQHDRKIPDTTFIYSTICSCITIVIIYMEYLFSYMGDQSTNQLPVENLSAQPQNSAYIYKLSVIVNKYVLFLVGCLYYKLHLALKERVDMGSSKENNKDRRKHSLFEWVMPNIERGFANIFLREISLIWICLMKAIVLAIYMSNFFYNFQTAVFNVFMLVYLVLIVQMPETFARQKLQDSLKYCWVYPFVLSFVFAVWDTSKIGFVGILFVRLYLIFYIEYNLATDYLQCEQVTKSQHQVVEKVNEKFNHLANDKLSMIPEQKENVERMILSSSDQQASKQWRYRNFYKTILLLLPTICFVFMFYGQLLLEKHLYSALFGIALLTLFFLTIKFIEKADFLKVVMRRAVQIYFMIHLAINFGAYYKLTDKEIDEQSWIRLGTFFLCAGYFFYFYLTFKSEKQCNPSYLISKSLKITFMESRCVQILHYWSVKSQFIGQLGSQIHNEKKLLKLQQYYDKKQKMSQRVKTLIQVVVGNDRIALRATNKGDIDIIDQMVGYKDEQQHYQLFSNMLIFLSLQDLQYCLQMMNHYYRSCVQSKHSALQASKNLNIDLNINTHEAMTTVMKEIRHNVLNTYHGSIYVAFKQYKIGLKEEYKAKMFVNYVQQVQHTQSKIIQNEIVQEKAQKQNSESQSSFSDQAEMVNFQKKTMMQSKYQKCMERIHQRSMQINWIWRKIIQNSQIISLVIVTGWNFFGGIYSIPTNFAIFAWAIVLENKTTVFLWMFFFLYAGFTIVMKIILPFLPRFGILDFIFYYNPTSVYYEFIIIVISTLQIFMIKLGGTQYKSFSERQTIYDAFYRKCLNRAAHKIQSPLQSQFIQVYKTLNTPQQHSFIYRVFSKSRLKPGKDFYPLQTGIQIALLLYIFCFYDMMQFQSRNNRKSMGQILAVNQLSKNMMIVLFTQVIIMIIDRIIVSLNIVDIKNQTLQNFLLNFAFSDVIKYHAPDDVTHVGFFDALLVIKYLFHIVLLVVINFFVYFYIPSSGFNKSLIPQCQNAICGKSYTYLSIFLLLYLAYFVASGLQIKHGFNREKFKNKLMEKYNYWNFYLFASFTTIPFLWQFKKICDWTITTTSLSFFNWMKFQDINAKVYTAKCQAEMLKKKPRAQTPLSKYVLGPIGCIFILGIVFSPLLIYSSLNPFAVRDEVLASQVTLNLQVNGTVDYKFFGSSQVFITADINALPTMYKKEFNSRQVYQDPDNNNFYLKMSSYPDQNFKISEPTIQTLSQRIDDAVSGKEYRYFQMIIMVKITQQQGGQHHIEWARKMLNNQQLLQFKTFILPEIDNDPTYTQIRDKWFILSDFYSPVPDMIQNKTISLLTRNDGEYYELSTIIQIPQSPKDEYLDPNTEPDQQSPGILLFYSSSTKYKISFGLVTFYLTYVLLISKMLRVYFTGNPENLMYEGADLERMMIMCNAVREARLSENLYHEEYIYSFIVDIMRNPTRLSEISGKFTKLREKLPLPQGMKVRK